MNSITQNLEKERYLPHELNTKYHSVLMYRNGASVRYVCKKYHISKRSLMRWNKRYDGSKESLIDKSHRPIEIHPNAHTDVEIKWIKDYTRRNPGITTNELWWKLKKDKGYRRHPGSLYRVLKRLGIISNPNMKGTSKYIPQKYDTQYI